MSKRDYYEVLGLARGADKSAIKSAYRKMAIKFHPDKNPNDSEAEEKFKEASEAYEVLSDDAKRQRYDQFGHEGLRGGRDYHTYTDINDIFSMFSDVFSGGGHGSIFDDFFSGGTRRSRSRNHGERGSDLKIRIPLTLEEIAKGTEKTLKIKRYDKCNTCNGTGAKNDSFKTCQQCGGTGEVRQVTRSVFGQFVNISPCSNCNGEGRIIAEPCTDCLGDGRTQIEDTIHVDIPPGVEEGNYLPVRGKGNVGRRGGSTGDLIVVMQEKEHDIFTRNANNILYRLQLSYPEAVLGASIEVPTLYGNETIHVEPGTQPNTTIKLSDKGIPELNGYRTGDQIVIVDIFVPRKLSAKEKNLIKELAASDNINPKKTDRKKKDFFDKVKDAFF